MRSSTDTDSVIVRLSGEIGIKSERTRQGYERLLLKNIRTTLLHFNIVPESVTRRRGRIYIGTTNAHETAARLTRVFGISSVSPAVKTSSNMREIGTTALSLASSTIREGTGFAVRCRRVGKHAYSSMDVCKRVGSQILERLKDRNVRVNLTSPDSTIGIEVRDKEGYAYTETLNGSGGFPVGSQGKAVCLLSGGIDSPVACWLMMKRGCPIIPVYLDNSPLTDETTTLRALETAKKLFEWSIGSASKVYIVPHGRNLENIMERAPRKLTCILCKRMMYRIAERIADIEGAEGIVTGEAIGEQASQTLTNLRVLDEAALRYPVHRPLLGFDKTETEALARRISTFEVSTRKAKSCCAAPNRPATRAKLDFVKKAEEKLDIVGATQESVRAAKIVTIRLDETY